MQKRGMARRAGGQPRLDEKSEKPLKSFEQPSNNHRSSIVTSRSPHAHRTPAARSQRAGRWLSAPALDGGGLGSWRAQNAYLSNEPRTCEVKEFGIPPFRQGQ